MNKVGGVVAVLAVAVLGCRPAVQASRRPISRRRRPNWWCTPVAARTCRSADRAVRGGQRWQAEVRYGDTAELAAQLLEEGDNSPADIFFAQDAGALQVIEDEGLATSLPADVVKKVPANFRSADDQWVGTSDPCTGDRLQHRSRTAEGFLTPCSSWSIPAGRGKWASPGRTPLRAFVTAMRVSVGEERTKQWQGAHRQRLTVENNLAILDTVNAGTVELGLANHYYLFEAAEVGAENLAVRNAAFQSGDPGNLVNVAGAAVLTSGADNAASEQFVDFLLSDEAQGYFAEETSEYPLVGGSPPARSAALVPDRRPDRPSTSLPTCAGTHDLLIQVGLL